MSQRDSTASAGDKIEQFRDIILDQFESYTKSRQALDAPGVEAHPNEGGHQRHNDGAAIYQRAGLPSLPDWLREAAREDSAVAKHPEAFAHFITHISAEEKWELADGKEPEDIAQNQPQRQDLLDWYLGRDKTDPEERERARRTRFDGLRDGGTGLILHGEQGTTKTTAMYWLIMNIMQANQQENVIWQSTLDDTEWQVFAPWATLCLPADVDVEVTANPYPSKYRSAGPIELDPSDVSRDTIRYSDPEDLLDQISERTAGQFYVAYPDPRFRECEALTDAQYESVWDVDRSVEATPLNHWWFALMETTVHNAEYNEWTTLVADEAHKWLRQGKGNDEHDWWNKIDDWATYWGDARKKRLSCILSIHQWSELHSKIRDKIRWAGTMNGEKFPSRCPLDGRNRNQELGEMVIWNREKFNHVGYPNLKKDMSIPGDIDVIYPGFEAEKRRK